MRGIAQAITDALAAPPGTRSLLRGSTGKKLRRWILRAHDPTVLYRVQGIEIELPFSHELPNHRRHYTHYDTALARLAQVGASVHLDGTILDVGANVGDSAALFRGGCGWPILCVEGEPRFFAYLKRNAQRVGGRVVLEQAFLGPEDGFVEARPVSRRGTARLEVSPGERLPILSLRTLLARHPDLPPLRIVKVDTDGYDWPILEAGLPTLGELRPALFYECDQAFYPAGWDPRPLWRRFAEAGYRTLVAYENTGELFCIADARDEVDLATLVAYPRVRKGSYLDVCAFHDSDAAFARAFIDSELGRLEVTLPTSAGADRGVARARAERG